MKRKLFIILTLIFIITFRFNVFADDIIINEDIQLEPYESDQYIPDDIKDILKDNGAESSDEIDPETVFEIIGSQIKISYSKYSASLTVIVSMIVLASVIKRIIRNERFLLSVSYITTLINIISIFGIFRDVLSNSINILTSLTEVLSLVLPSLYAILLTSGCTFSALVSGASFGVALSFINNVIIQFMSPLIYILLIMMLFEKVSTYLSDTGLFKVAKNTVMNTLKFITTVLLSVMSFQSILGASKDSVSLRAVKFAASNFIPIVGGVVSESMRTISAGLKLLRTSVGGTFIIAIFLTVLPIIIDIFLLKTMLSIFSIFSGLLGATGEKSLYDSSVDILNVLNGIIIFSLLISVISVILFITTGFITSY